MIPQQESCPRCNTTRVVGYYDGDGVYISIRSTCTCMNTIGRRFSPPGILDRMRRRDKRNAILEIHVH